MQFISLKAHLVSRNYFLDDFIILELLFTYRFTIVTCSSRVGSLVSMYLWKTCRWVVYTMRRRVSYWKEQCNNFWCRYTLLHSVEKPFIPMFSCWDDLLKKLLFCEIKFIKGIIKGCIFSLRVFFSANYCQCPPLVICIKVLW